MSKGINTNIREMVDTIYKEIEKNNESTKQRIGKHHSDELVERKENERFHDTYFFEQKMLSFVEKGDVEGLKNFFSNIPNMSAGQVSYNSLRQAQNIFIANTTLATRAAIAGGLDIETAYQLSDSYILEVERMSDTMTITTLNFTCLIDFTKRVSEARIPMGMSREIYTVIQYIGNHVNSNISVEEIAEHLHMDRSTLSKKFKRELGFNISSYIMRRKLEEAKSLLLNSDKTISEISEYLCFSSQSYFQNVFKAKYSMTPKDFRNTKKLKLVRASDNYY